jgi:hypothetical protein
LKTVNLIDVRLKLLVYGAAGAGKTTFCGSAALDPRTAPVFWVNAFGNPQSLRRQQTLPAAIVDLGNPNELEQIYRFFADGQPDGSPFLKATNGEKYKTLVFDGFSALQDDVFNIILQGGKRRPGSIPPKPTYNHWGELLRFGNEWGAAFYKLDGLHVITTAIEEDLILENDMVQKPIYPLIQGKSRKMVPSFALGVYRIATTHTERGLTQGAQFNALFTRETRKMYAKDQHLIDPSKLTKDGVMLDPTITKLLDAIGG